MFVYYNIKNVDTNNITLLPKINCEISEVFKNSLFKE